MQSTNIGIFRKKAAI